MKGFAMTNAFTLDDLNTALDTKYGPFVFQSGKEKFNLSQVLRLPKEVRAEVKSLLESLDQEGAEPDEEVALDTLEKILILVTEDGKGSRLLEILEHDMLKISIIFEKWVEKTQVGEA